MIAAALFLLGLFLLVAGAEAFVRGASSLARLAGISPLVVGLTVVACGTSAPELAVSVGASLQGRPDIALGNVIGSNILNVLLLLGVAALIAPLTVSRQLVRLDVPIMVGVSILLGLLAWDGTIGRIEGALLLAGIVAYTAFLVVLGRREAAAGSPPGIGRNGEGSRSGPAARGVQAAVRASVLLLGGLVLLVAGARWLLEGAIAFARAAGVSELIIGLTIVAAGTSLPEAATSIAAAVRGERDIAVGNAVGSNTFNILAVLGLSAVASPEGIPVAPAALSFDIPVMIAAAFACMPVFASGGRIDRWEGVLFLGYYAAYVGYLILDAKGHDALPAFSSTMLEFVVPLTIVTFLVLVAHGALGGTGKRPGKH